MKLAFRLLLALAAGALMKVGTLCALLAMCVLVILSAFQAQAGDWSLLLTVLILCAAHSAVAAENYGDDSSVFAALFIRVVMGILVCLIAFFRADWAVLITTVSAAAAYGVSLLGRNILLSDE